jgi:hypothetical protein
LLAIFGGLALSEYEFIEFRGRESGLACIYAAIIYAGIFVIIVYMKYRNRTSLKEVIIRTHLESSDRENSL